MATGTVLCPINGAAIPDGSSGNAAPAIALIQGTETNPKKHFFVAQFDAATAEHLWWSFRMPADYASGGTIKLQWYANATANSVVWAARIAAVTPGDADTPIEHAAAAASSTTTAVNTTEANRETETSVTLANLDSVAAGDRVFLCVFRDAANGSDTCTVDAVLMDAVIEYTTT